MKFDCKKKQNYIKLCNDLQFHSAIHQNDNGTATVLHEMIVTYWAPQSINWQNKLLAAFVFN